MTAPTWPPLPVFGPGNARTVRLQFVPMFTVADPAGFFAPDERPRLSGTAGNQLELVLGFVAEDDPDPLARGPRATARPTRSHRNPSDGQGNSALETMVETFFRWAAHAGAGKGGNQQLSLHALQDLLTELGELSFRQVSFGYPNLAALFSDSLHFEVAGYPSGATARRGGILVPVLPPVVAHVQAGASSLSRAYANYQPVSSSYADNLRAYFQQLLTSGPDEPSPTDTPPTATVQADTAPAGSLAGLIFGEYFALLTQAALQAAIALLRRYPVEDPSAGGPSLDQLAEVGASIRDVPSRTVNEFVTELTSAGQLNTIAGQLSNFLAHGLRAPAPDDRAFTGLTPRQVLAGEFTGTLYGLTDLIGQQFCWPDQSVPVKLSLTHAGTDWLSFIDAVTDPAMPVNELSLTIDQDGFGSQLPSTTVTLHAQPPAVLANFEQVAVHYNFEATQHWQAAARPSLPSGPPAGAPGELSLWPLPATLAQAAASGDYPFTLNTFPRSGRPGTEGSPLASYCWAIQLPIAISRVANPTDPNASNNGAGERSEAGSAWLDGVYLVRGTSAADSERLHNLRSYLAAGPDTGQLSLLYQPNATGHTPNGHTPNGYASDALDPATTVLLLSAPSMTGCSAPISATVDFLTLLWQASVAVQDGCYLHYDAAGAGLSDSIFDGTGRASLQLLCLLHSQAGAASSGGPLLALNNVAVVNDNVDASAVRLHAVRSDAGAPMTRVATVPAGSVGFEIVRPDPAPPVGTDPSPDQLAGMLYGLIGYQVQAGSGFRAGNEAVPQGPVRATGEGPTLAYRQVLSAFPLAAPDGQPGDAASTNRWLPAAGQDPYAGISTTSAVVLSFAAHDVFGNRALITDPIGTLSVPARYTDRLAGIGDWPGTSWGYTLTGRTPTVQLLVAGVLQADRYLPGPQLSSESALRTASGHAVKLSEAFYQLGRPGMAISLASTLAGQPLTPGPAALVGYLSSAYCFTSQLAGLPIKTHRVSGGQQLGSVAGSYAVAASDLLRDNLDRPANEVFASTVVLPVFDQAKHGETQNAQNTVAAPSDTLRHLVNQTGSDTLADFAAANAGSELADGSTLLLPALLDPTALAATPYQIQPAVTFNQIATRFGITAQVLGGQVQDIPAIFVTAQPVAVTGHGSVQTDSQDSLTSLIAKFPAGNQPSLATLITAIGDQAGLLLAGAALVCPVPRAEPSGTGPALSITAVASSFGQPSDALAVAKCNAAIIGFLKQGTTFSIDGHDFTVARWQTLANTLGQVNAVLGSPLGYDALLTALLDQPIVDPASKVLLPPGGVRLSVPLPAEPAVTDVITPLELTLTLIRPPAEIDPNFGTVTEVQRASSTIPPAATGEPATLTGFADAVAEAYGGALWVATAAAAEQGLQRQYLVRFAAPSKQPSGNAIREIRIGGSPSYLGLPPLANSLISRTAEIRNYQQATDPPFSQDAQTQTLQAVDVTEWVTDFLATLDLALSPGYASAGYHLAGGPALLDALVAAKASLASKIAGQLRPIEAGDSALDLTAAQQALEQRLRANLSTGYHTDAVLQVPSTVQASFAGTGSDAGGHRLGGKLDAVALDLSSTSTLHQLAVRFVVSEEAITELLGATTDILATGTVLELAGTSWTIAAQDSLNTGIAALHTTPAIFASTFTGTSSLFRDGVSLAIDGFTAQVGAGDTMNSVADALDVSLSLLAMANQDLTGLLTGTVYLLGQPVQITAQTSSLAGLAAAQAQSVAAVAALIADQAVLAAGQVMHIARWVAECSLTTGKIDLDAASGALTVLLSMKNRAHYRRLFLNLTFGINALEYAIDAAGFGDGYQNSKWLHLVNPLPATPGALAGAVIQTGIGQLAVPIAQRAYPATPRLVSQSAQASYSAEQLATSEPSQRIGKAQAWSYQAGFELQLADQDSAIITVGLNYAPSQQQRVALAAADNPFPALAEYASNAPAIKTDLASLIRPAATADTVSPGRSALAALAELATRVAGSWGFVANTPSALATDAGDGLVPAVSYSFGLHARTRSGDSGEPLLAALVLIRQPGTDSWGPGQSIPMLGYLDDAGRLQALIPPEPPVGPAPATLSYTFANEVPANGLQTYLISYDDLNVVSFQNARASVTVTRNQKLAPGKTTNAEFGYRTPALTFTDLAVPSLQWDQSLLFGAGSVAQLPPALGQLFNAVLGNPPTAAATEQKLSANYGHRLVPAGEPDSPLSPDDLVSLTPIFYRPNFGYTDSVPTDTGAAVSDWLDNQAPEPDNLAFLSLELQLFSTALPEHQQPIMRFSRLDYLLASFPTEPA